MTNPNFAAPQTNPFNLQNVGIYTAPTFADIDGDGDLDAFVGNKDGNILYFQNQGDDSNPNFAAPQTNPFNLEDVGNESIPTFADIDGDGDLDAFVGNTDGNILYFQNQGDGSTPNFTAPQTNPFNLQDLGSYASPSLTDIDADGDLDAFVGNKNGDILYFQNQGDDSTPNFTASQTNPFNLENVGTSASPTFADIDRDGDLDAFIGNLDGNILYFENQGDDSTPNFAAPQTNPFNLQDVGSSAIPTFADIDGDGDIDAFAGNSNSTILYFRATDIPTDISLDSTSIEENVDVPRVVGNLSTTDPNTDDTFTYTLVEGFGDNSEFTIAGNELIINNSPDFETKSGYSIRIKTTDSTNNELEKTFTINVSDVEEPIIIDEAEGGTNKLLGGRFGDTLSGNDGRDYIKGFEGDDVLNGGEDNDRVYGGTGDDTLDGGNGDDYLKAGTENDQLSGGDGRDRLYGGGGDDTITGDAGNDFLRGDEGNDSLDGGAGKDRLYGGTGDDTLTGVDLTTFGVGERDYLRGNAGADTFVLGNGSRAFYHDEDNTTKGKSDYGYIVDFEAGDTIQLYGSAEDYTLDVFRGSTSIYMNDDGVGDLIGKIKGVSLEDMSSGFIFVLEES